MRATHAGHTNYIVRSKQRKDMKQRAIIIITFLSIGFTCYSQKVLISREKAINDIDTMQKYIEKIHPNAYAYKSKNIIDNLYERVKSKIADSISIYELYNYASFITANYGDGHLSVIFPNNWNSENHLVIPFTIEISNKKVLVKRIIDRNVIYENSEIIKINGIPIDVIIDTMIVSRSGEALHFKKEMVKYYFPNLLYSIYGFENKFEVQFKQNNTIKTHVLEGIDYKNYLKMLNGDDYNTLDFSAKFFKEKNICLIDFREFSDLERFKTFLDTVFYKIKRDSIKNLIIDIRNNSGGNSVLGDELFQYISKTDFTQYDKTILKVSSHLKSLWTSYYLPQGVIDSITVDKLLKLPNGIIVRTDTVFNDDDDETIKLNAISNRFYGNVYVLISNFTFSSAADFAWCFKHYNIGKVIGEETGGWGLCYGDNVYTELPNSRLPINVSCKLFYNIGATEASTHGVIPDFQVKSEDALEYAIKIIDKRE